MKRFDPLTYRFPRSLNEAFPNTAEYANAFEDHIHIGVPHADRVVVIACLIAGVAVAVLAVLRALPGGAA
jgi:hypothetical protein